MAAKVIPRAEGPIVGAWAALGDQVGAGDSSVTDLRGKFVKFECQNFSKVNEV